jgi:general secretion pathway protein M
MKTSTPLAQALQPLRARWLQLAAREQNLVLAAGAVVALALLWALAVAPALHSLHTAPARHALADQQLQRMLKMQAQAQQLRQHASSQPPQMGDIQALLQKSLQAELGASARMQWLGNRVQITLTAAPAPALARWLAQVRDNTHASASEMKLSRAPAADKPAADTLTRWSGSLMLDLPDPAAQ